MDELRMPTNELLSGLERHSKLIGAKLSKGTIHEALKYNLIDLIATFRELNSLSKRESSFINAYGMLCRAAQESTATTLYLSTKAETKHKQYCDDLIYNSDLLHYVYHVLEDEKDEEYALKGLRDDVWSWTKSSYAHRIRKSLGLGEVAFYQYTSALAHYSMINAYFIETHPEDFEVISNLFLFKINKYIYLTISKMIELGTITNSVLLLLMRTYLSKAEPVMATLEGYELNEILSLKAFKPHKH